MTYYICRKVNYGANNNFTRYEVLNEYDPVSIRDELDFYKRWCRVLIILLLCCIGTMIWYYKIHPCMTDWKIAEYLKEHRQ